MTRMIHHAALDGDIEEIKALLEKDPRLIHAQDEDGWTPLICAAYAGNLGVVRYLLDQGANIDHRHTSGGTALHRACYHGRREVVGLLLERGASVVLRGYCGRTPLIDAAYSGYVEVARLLLRHGGSELDAANDKGQTALFLACQSGHSDVALALLEAGADPRRADDGGKLPFTVAAERDRQPCLKLLEDWERGLVLCKARRIHNAAMTISRCPADAKAQATKAAATRSQKAAPAFLKSRASAGEQLPTVEICRDVFFGKKRERASEDEGAGSDALGLNVVEFGMEQLKGELFVELMSVLG